MYLLSTRHRLALERIDGQIRGMSCDQVRSNVLDLSCSIFALNPRFRGWVPIYICRAIGCTEFVRLYCQRVSKRTTGARKFFMTYLATQWVTTKSCINVTEVLVILSMVRGLVDKGTKHNLLHVGTSTLYIYWERPRTWHNRTAHFSETPYHLISDPCLIMSQRVMGSLTTNRDTVCYMTHVA